MPKVILRYKVMFDEQRTIEVSREKYDEIVSTISELNVLQEFDREHLPDCAVEETLEVYDGETDEFLAAY